MSINKLFNILNRQCLHKAVEVVECIDKDNTNVLITGKSTMFKLY